MLALLSLPPHQTIAVRGIVMPNDSAPGLDQGGPITRHDVVVPVEAALADGAAGTRHDQQFTALKCRSADADVIRSAAVGVAGGTGLMFYFVTTTQYSGPPAIAARARLAAIPLPLAAVSHRTKSTVYP